MNNYMYKYVDFNLQTIVSNNFTQTFLSEKGLSELIMFLKGQSGKIKGVILAVYQLIAFFNGYRRLASIQFYYRDIEPF